MIINFDKVQICSSQSSWWRFT